MIYFFVKLKNDKLFKRLGFVNAMSTNMDMQFRVMEAEWLLNKIKLKLFQNLKPQVFMTFVF
jgi:hypothetical protein